MVIPCMFCLTHFQYCILLPRKFLSVQLSVVSYIKRKALNSALTRTLSEIGGLPVQGFLF